MGTYRIVIEGTGAHHNPPAQGKDSNDADLIAAALVEVLVENGHKVTAAAFELVDQNGTAYRRDAVPGIPIALNRDPHVGALAAIPIPREINGG